MRLHDFLDYRAREQGEHPFAIQGDRQMSYAEARDETFKIGNALIGGGLGIGDRIAILSKNSIEMALLYYACSRAGVAAIESPPRVMQTQWFYQVLHACFAQTIAASHAIPRPVVILHRS